ncbi:MAG: MFS transporter [Pseudomonadota bacterium]
MSATLARLLPLYVVVFIGFLGYSLTVTVFTPLIMQAEGGMIAKGTSTGTRTIILGILLSLYPFGQFVSAPILGSLSDRYGRRPVLLTSLVLAAAVYVMLAMALETHNLALLMVACLLGGLCEGNVTISQSAIADVTAAEERGRYFGYVYFTISFAFVVGPLFGGNLADASLVSWFSNATPFWVVCGLLTVTMVWAIFRLGETRTAQPADRIRLFDAFTNLFNVVTDRRLRMLYLINLCIYLAIFGFFRSYPLYLVDAFDLDVTQLAMFIAWVSVPVMAINLFAIAWLMRRFSIKRMVFWSAILLAVSMIAVLVPSSQSGLWFPLFFAGLFLAICLPACTSVLSFAVGEDEQGQVLGNNQSLQVGSESLSGLVVGFLAAVFIPLPMIVLAVIAVTGAGLLKLYERRS